MHGGTVSVLDSYIYMSARRAERMVVLDDEPADRGHATPPQEMREGMNEFLADLDITFRRDERTGRPRINKPGSQLDSQQKRDGEYYYST